MAVLFVFVVSAIQAGSSKHSNVCSVKLPPKADICAITCKLPVCVSKVSPSGSFCDISRFVLKYCLLLPTLGTCSRQLVKTVAWGLRGLKQARGGFSQDVEFGGIRGGWREGCFYKTWSVFKSARQIGLKGLLAGWTRKGGEGKALGLRGASVGGFSSYGSLLAWAGWQAGGRHLEAAPVTGQVRAGHCQGMAHGGASAQPRPSPPPDSSPATPSRPSHWPPRAPPPSVDPVDPYLGRGRCGGVAAHPQSHPRAGQRCWVAPNGNCPTDSSRAVRSNWATGQHAGAAQACPTRWEDRPSAYSSLPGDKRWHGGVKVHRRVCGGFSSSSSVM